MPQLDLNPADRIRLVVLFGGQSAEHEVSCTTAAHVIAAADPNKYDVVPIGITTEGQWVNSGYASALLGRGVEKLSPVGEPTDPSQALSTVGSQQLVVLPLLHGPMGEDGTMQGLLEIAGVPYIGAGVLGSALTMDKAKAKDMCAQAGIPQTRWLPLHEDDFNGDTSPFSDDLGFPLFVKPANMGSSVGVSKADSPQELAAALKLAFRYDEWVVIEEGVEAREIEFAILGNRSLSVSVPGEIVPSADFYDYENKYLDGSAELVIPADLDPETITQMTSIATHAYRVLRVEGMARADFLFEDGGRGPLLNELNTIPGFTPISMYPKLWQASGVGYSELIDRLVELAMERFSKRSSKRMSNRAIGVGTD